MTDQTYVYEGQELELFAHATHWKDYWSSRIAPYLKGDVLEVGAGTGTNTAILRPLVAGRWVCLEPDRALAGQIAPFTSKTVAAPPDVIEVGTLASLPVAAAFQTILYIDVLEHIPNDKMELDLAARHLDSGGRLIVLAPAHQWLFTNFDRAIGHCRRYSRSSLLALGPSILQLESAFYLDSVGMLLSLGNRLLLRRSMPTLQQILVWDRFVVPASRRLDPLLAHCAGKTIIAIWRKQVR